MSLADIPPMTVRCATETHVITDANCPHCLIRELEAERTLLLDDVDKWQSGFYDKCKRIRDLEAARESSAQASATLRDESMAKNERIARLEAALRGALELDTTMGLDQPPALCWTLGRLSMSDDDERQVWIIGWVCAALMAVAFASCTAIIYVSDPARHSNRGGDAK